jgi:hypothetical protein
MKKPVAKTLAQRVMKTKAKKPPHKALTALANPALLPNLRRSVKL